jgi:YidC/Oxa1 family membrane protein insertase
VESPSSAPPNAPAKDVPAPSATPAATGTAASVPSPTGAQPTGGQKVTIKTDLYTAEVDTAGGVITLISLNKHSDATDPTKPYHVLQRTAERVFVAQVGLVGAGQPNHVQTVYEPLPGPRELAPGAERVDLRLATTLPNGNKVVEVLTFHRGSYVIDVAFDITNNGKEPITPEAYFQLLRDTKQAVVQSSMAPAAYVGPVVYNDKDNFKKIEFSEIDKQAADPNRKPAYQKSADNGWIGMIEHYFVAAWLPPDRPIIRQFYTTKLDNGLYTAGVRFGEGTIPPGATGELRARLYVGPQDQDVLAQTAKGLDLVVDYGIFTVLAAPLFWLLKWLHGIIGNWGWSIIVMTIMIKAAFYPLNAAAARSMGKMKIIAPKMKALQEQYANDKQQLQIKMMEMYKTEKINPLGGCLPILVQIPVFIALYWVLLSAVELRQAPWILWIKDLSAPDPYFVLPVIYAITAYLQVKLSPTPISDPVQAKVMQIMPIAFSVLFIFFPSGLVLYWLVNNILQIAQQWQMNRMLEREAAAKAATKR